MLDSTKKYIWQRNKLRIESLTRFRKDIDLHLIVLTGHLMSRGNSLKIYFVPIPFCGPSLSEVILTHEEQNTLQEFRVDQINQIIDEIQINNHEQNTNGLYESIQKLKLLDNVFNHPRLATIYNNLATKFTPKALCLKKNSASPIQSNQVSRWCLV